MSSKDLIINRLRQAQEKKRIPLPVLKPDRELFSDYVADNKTLMRHFEQKLTQLHGEFFHFQTIVAAAEHVYHLCKEPGPNTCIAHDFKLLEFLFSAKRELKEQIRVSSDAFISTDALARYQIGITAAKFLIARTGSVVVTSTACGGRRLSILPPVHIVLAKSDQIVFSLEDLWSRMPENQENWSTLSIITGPSRTSDIEKQLVLGAHGPKKLIVIIIDAE